MNDSHTTVETEFLFDLAIGAAPDPRTMVPDGPYGTRGAVCVTGGTFQGPRLQGEVLPPGGDWLIVRANGTIQLDVRLSLFTADGAAILMQYKGIGGQPRDGRRELRIAPLFETGDERYAWLNDLQAIGIGHADIDTGSVRYAIYGVR